MLQISTPEELLQHGKAYEYHKVPTVQAVCMSEPFEVTTIVNGKVESIFKGAAGDYVIIGVQGEIYLNQAATFLATYERVYSPTPPMPRPRVRDASERAD